MVRECACGCGTEFDNSGDLRRKYAAGHQKSATQHAARDARTEEIHASMVCGNPACQKVYAAANVRNQFCPDCRALLELAKEIHYVPFVAVDGEGIPRWCNACDCKQYEPANPDDEKDVLCVCGHAKTAQRYKLRGQMAIKPGHEHCYVELGCGDDQIENYDGLTFGEIFDFLYNKCRPKYPPNTAFVGYSLGYDWNMWLKTMPETQVAKLLLDECINKRKRHNAPKGMSPIHVHVTDDKTGVEWEIDMLPGRRFSLRPRPYYGEFTEYEIPDDLMAKLNDGLNFREYRVRHAAQAGHIKVRVVQKKRETPWLYINDVFSFWQKSFLAAIKPDEYPPGDAPVSAEDYAEIKRGKERRSYARLDDEMRHYNRLENRALARLMQHLNSNLTDYLGIRLDKAHWFGPGQIAQALLRKWGAPTRQAVEEAIPANVLEDVKKSFLAGWFEIFSHLHVAGPTYEYDINSAYPYIMKDLPCPLHGRWVDDYPVAKMPVTKMPKLAGNAYRIIHARVHGSDPYIGAMLHRNLTGNVLRPHNTEGWYWQRELEAAMRAGLIDRIEIIEWHTYYPCECPPPCAPIADLYAQRLKVGKNSPAGKTFKLGYNSPYGKTAQSIGDPKYTNWIWASLITSGCRTMILDAIATHPEGTKAVRMVATDGVYFRSPHPSLPISKTELGKWDESKKRNMLLYKPGVYWDDDGRDAVRNDKALSLKSRGISARSVAKELDRIDRDSIAWSPAIDEWPTVKVHSSFAMISAVQALRWGRFPARQRRILGPTQPRSQRSKWYLAGLVTEGDESIQSADPSSKRQVCTLCRAPHDIRPDPDASQWDGDNPIPPTRHTHNMDGVYQDAETGEWRARVYWAGHLNGDGTPGTCIPHNENAPKSVGPDTITDNGYNNDLWREGIGLE